MSHDAREERGTELGQHDSDEPTSAVGERKSEISKKKGRKLGERWYGVRAKLDGRGVLLEVARGKGVGLLEILAQHDALSKRRG
jgi:hypothetical protein